MYLKPFLVMLTLGCLMATLANAETESMEITRTIKVRPGKEFVIKYDAESGRLIFPKPLPELELPAVAIDALGKAPKWLREDLKRNFEQLRLDRIDTTNFHSISFGDLNNDSRPDLIVGQKDGKLVPYIAPHFIIDREILSKVNVLKNAAAAVADMNFDGVNDIIIGNHQGTLLCLAGPDFKNPITTFEKFPKINNARPVFFDTNDDGKKDLVVFGSDGRSSAIFVANNKSWKESEKKSNFKCSYITGAPENTDHTLLCVDSKGHYYTLNKTTGREEIKGLVMPNSNPAYTDVDHDGLPDIVVAIPKYGIFYYKNYGRTGKPKFIINDKTSQVQFPINAGNLSSPVFADVNNDGRDDLIVGNKEGKALVFVAPDWKQQPKPLIEVDGYLNVGCGDFDGDGKKDLVFGDKHGNVTFRFTSFENEIKPAKCVARFAAPNGGDIDGDGRDELVVGTDKSVRIFRVVLNGENSKLDLIREINIYTPQKGKKEIAGLPHTLSSFSPAIFDVDGDGKQDLIVGSRDGSIRAFRLSDMKELSEEMFELHAGEFSTPVFHDVNKDGKTDIVSGNVNGQIVYFENIGKGEKNSWREKFSWHRLSESGNDKVKGAYEMRYPKSGYRLFGANDYETLETYAVLIGKSEKRFVDELAFCIAYTPSEFLRTAARLGEADLYLENVRGIYDIAPELDYVKIIEKEDYTTLEYADKNGSFQLPRDVYYWWVVHPTTLREIPIRVDYSWWDTPHDKRGMTKIEWLRHKEKDIYTDLKKAKFWRSVLPGDKVHGHSLLEKVGKAKTFSEATLKLHDYLSRRCPDGFMDFGYLTDDAQPLMIYRKAYGSCGEQSIIGVAATRTALIPCTSVTNYGEDHQWNEYWYRGRWYHWDINYFPANGLCLPGGLNCDAAWMTDKLISSVIRVWGDGRHDATTAIIDNSPRGKNTKSGLGYTDTAEVKCVVLDKNGKPIDGALILVTSHNRDPHRLAYYEYTNSFGVCTIDLGYINRGGYTLVAITPFGSAGIQNFAVKPLEKYELTFITGGENPLFTEVQPGKSKSSSEPNFILEGRVKRAVLSTANYVTTYSGEPKGVVYDKTRYLGTRFTQYPLNSAKIDWLLFDEPNYKKYISGQPAQSADLALGKDNNKISLSLAKEDLYIILSNRSAMFVTPEVELKLNRSGIKKKPELTFNPLKNKDGSYTTGETIVLSGTATDNLGIKQLLLSYNGGITFRDITNSLSENGIWKYNLTKDMGGMTFPGRYRFVVKALDYSGNESVVGIRPIEFIFAKKMPAQIIRQDNPDDPLNPKSSWILGPFRVIDERFLDIKASCKNEKVDIDLWLYYDKNNNGNVDKDEVAMKSANPASSEHIFTTNVQAGSYWIYVHGWEVPNGQNVFDIELSFRPTPRLITGYSPAGYASPGENITFNLNSPGGFDKKAVKVMVNGIDCTDLGELKNNRFMIPALKLKAHLNGRENSISVSVEDYLGNKDSIAWNFKGDSEPPIITGLPKLKKTIHGAEPVILKAVDNVAVKSAKMIIGTNKPVALAKLDKDTFRTLYDFGAIKPGRYKMRFVVEDMAGNKFEKTSSVKIGMPPNIRFGKVFPSVGVTLHRDRFSGTTLYQDRPILQAEVVSKVKVNPAKFRVIFDGRDVTRISEITSNNLRYIPPKPLREGNHTIIFIAVTQKGEKVKLEIPFKSSLKGKPKIRPYVK